MNGLRSRGSLAGLVDLSGGYLEFALGELLTPGAAKKE
jgi:hypothetical protein